MKNRILSLVDTVGLRCKQLWKNLRVLSYSPNSPSEKFNMTHGTLPPRHTLSIKDAAVLEPFYRAQKVHDKPKTWRELRASGLKPIEWEKMDMKDICDKAGLLDKYEKMVKLRAKKTKIKL